MKRANKQDVIKMCSDYGLSLYRQRKPSKGLIIKDGRIVVFEWFTHGKPEVVWAYIWSWANDKVYGYLHCMNKI